MESYLMKAKVTDQNESAYYVQDDQANTYQLEKSQCDTPLNKGDQVTGVGYIDRHNKPRFVIQPPVIITEGYSWGKVVGKQPRLGLFVDVGLEDKDIVVSLDDLPEDVSEWPILDAYLLVKLEIDQKQRFWGKLLPASELEMIRRPAPKRLMNQTIKVTFVEDKGVGIVGLSEESFEVFVHESEQLDPIKVGDTLSIRIIKVHPDGRLNGSTRPRAYEALDDDAKMIEAILTKMPNHFLPLHDKSPSKTIQQQLGISKSQFKRAVGRLLKQDRIYQVINEGIYLKD